MKTLEEENFWKKQVERTNDQTTQEYVEGVGGGREIGHERSRKKQEGGRVGEQEKEIRDGE